VIYQLATEPTGRQYAHLIDVAKTYCSRFLLVERHDLSLGQRAKDVIAALDRFLLAHAEASEWPGTRLIGHAALVREYTFDDDSAEALVAWAPRLYTWQQPDMLEDLCLLQSDRLPWLITIAHEGDGYLVLGPNAAQLLQAGGLRIGELPEMPMPKAVPML
jgi:hypothetical protein